MNEDHSAIGRFPVRRGNEIFTVGNYAWRVCGAGGGGGNSKNATHQGGAERC